MTFEVLETIKANHPVRGEFAECSTGSARGYYYHTKGGAINAFDGALAAYELCLDRDDLMFFDGDEGRKTIDVHNEFKRTVGRAVLSWYRMPSGRYEFVGYLA